MAKDTHSTTFTIDDAIRRFRAKAVASIGDSSLKQSINEELQIANWLEELKLIKQPQEIKANIFSI